MDMARLKGGARAGQDRNRSASAHIEFAKFASAPAECGIGGVDANGEAFDRAVQQPGAMGVDGNLNSVSAAASGARNLEAIQVEGNPFRVDLDSVCLGYSDVARQVIGTRLIDNEMIIRIGRIDTGRRGRGLEVRARF